VTVVFDNKLMRGNRSKKMDNHGLDAFDSPNLPPLATLDININCLLSIFLFDISSYTYFAIRQLKNIFSEKRARIPKRCHRTFHRTH
jgi:L-asparaginase/Glu-tRNA(Gln) amidotransferase subunit D